MRSSIAILPFLIAAGPVSAQQADWTYAATIYGWLPGLSASVETDFGTVESDSDGSIDLSNLNMAFMGIFEARNGPWGVIGDLLYVDMGATEATPAGLAFSDAQVETKVTAFSGYVAYRVYDGPDLTFDIAGGFRAFGMDVDTKLDGNRRPSEHVNQSASWVDPLIAARVTIPFGENWFATATADIGGYVTQDSSTWQAIGLVGYRFNEAWSAELGYRYLDVRKEVSGDEIELGLGGPVIGATYRF